MATKAASYHVLNSPIDDLLDKCVSPEDIAYAIQKLGYAAKRMVEMDRSDFPIPVANQIWNVKPHGIVTLRTSFRSQIKVYSDMGKEIADLDTPDKCRLWLYNRDARLVADNLTDLVRVAIPDLADEQDEEDLEDTQTEIALLPVE